MSDTITTSEISKNFEYYLSVLKKHLNYVEDISFKWDDVCGILIVQLKNTDSLNKERNASHATQIQITSESVPVVGMSKTEDFFPTLTMNTSFKSWRLSLAVRINTENIASLDESASATSDKWLDDSVQIRRRLLNESDDNPGNPTLQICYGEDLMPLRQRLKVNDYLVFVKRRLAAVYEVFGVKSDVDLGSGKRLFKSDKASTDSTVFSITQLTEEKSDIEVATTYLDSTSRLQSGTNVLLYGVPGSGKSWTIEHEYCNEDSIVERLVFHPDYTNADFVGQILPVVDEDKQVTYEFTPGPFTTILCNAYRNPMRKYILIIEEINRGNAPAIFGEVFQLLDRKVQMQEGDDGFPVGTSEYGITHKYMAEFVYGNPAHKVSIPSNLSIIGTMNTSDQNVFTLDTAFQRRWQMRLIENNFDNVRPSLADAGILDTGVSWKRFCETINTIIIGNKAKMASAEDKRLGVYFVHESDLTFDQRALPSEGNSTVLVEYNSLLGTERGGSITVEQKSRLMEIREAVMHNRLFPEKVIKYLWDDAFKFNPEALFDSDMDNLEKVIRTFVYSTGQDRFKIFKQSVRDTLYTAQQQ